MNNKTVNFTSDQQFVKKGDYKSKCKKKKKN